MPGGGWDRRVASPTSDNEGCVLSVIARRRSRRSNPAAARDSLDCFAPLAMTAEGVRVAGMFQPSRGVPHPTPLRGATFSRGREKDSRANLPPSPSPSPRGRGVRVAGMSQPSRGVPHPTPLRGATFSRGREKDSRANLPPSPSPSPRGGGVRVVGMFQPSPSVPHPTPLRGATFSHWWEKGGAIERKLRGFNAFAPLGPLKNCRGSGTTGASPGFLVIAESAGGVLDNLRRLNHEQRT